MIDSGMFPQLENNFDIMKLPILSDKCGFGRLQRPLNSTITISIYKLDYQYYFVVNVIDILRFVLLK